MAQISFIRRAGAARDDRFTLPETRHGQKARKDREYQDLIVDFYRMPMNIDDCLKILELKRGASIEEIKTARIELLQVWHPDKYVSNPNLSEKAQEKTLKINEAFRILIKEIDLKEPEINS